MTTPNIDTKALRQAVERINSERRLRMSIDDHGERTMSRMREDKAKGEILTAAPALLDLADRAQEQAKEIDRLRKEMYEVWRYALGCDCVPESAYTCRACAIDYPAADVVGELRRARDDSDELWEIVSGVIPDWNEREDEGETKQNRLQSIVDERDALKAEVERLQIEKQNLVNVVAKLSASEREAERLTAEREDLLKSRDRVIAERNEQSGLRDKLIERMTASDETWSEALGNERKLRDASEREVERLREALTTIDEAFAEGGFFDDGFARSTIRAALRGEEAPRE